MKDTTHLKVGQAMPDPIATGPPGREAAGGEPALLILRNVMLHYYDV